MERDRGCVERNRSERAKVASVAEWMPPASPEALKNAPCGGASARRVSYAWEVRYTRKNSSPGGTVCISAIM